MRNFLSESKLFSLSAIIREAIVLSRNEILNRVKEDDRRRRRRRR